MKKIGKIIFIICIFCWIIYFLLGLKAAFFGSYPVNFGWPSNESLNREMIYGIESFKNTMLGIGFAFSIIPILPFSLIYIIVYIIVRKSGK